MSVITVSELTHAIQRILEPRFAELSVKGEMSNIKLQSSGHLYFTLKDANSQISAVLFKASAASLTRMPKEGEEVILKGKLGLYAPRGQYQIIGKELQFLGVGELLLKFHRLKEELGKQGFFDPARKKNLPKFPRTIGVVTSPTGAVIQDILHVLTRRFSGIAVRLYPVKVQGEGAGLEIAQAIREMNRYALADVLIVGRGGGSIEDLWAFNEEVVAKAIFESKIPIISAVGHETDFTIADWVADVRAPTPSAAAEIAIAEKAGCLRYLHQSREVLEQRLLREIKLTKLRLDALKRHPLLSSPYAILSLPLQRLDQFREDIDASIKRLLGQKKDLLKRLSAHLQSIHPNRLLKKGYVLLFAEKGGSLILSSKEVAPSQSLSILLHDGKISATVTQVEPNELSV